MTDWQVIGSLEAGCFVERERVRERFVTYLEISTPLREVEHANIADS